VLGLDPPTLAPCPDGCANTGPTLDAALDVSGSQDRVSGESETETPASDASNDIAIDQAVRDVGSSEASTDAAPDREAGPAPPGVLCGLGSPGAAAPRCGQFGGTPYCCETGDDAGQPSFACVSGPAACAGYPIQCAKDGDCAGTNICCHHESGMTCEEAVPASGTCASGTQACDPLESDPNECPKGTTCKASLTNDQLASPYLGCQ
jgi:hypothetical protein